MRDVGLASFLRNMPSANNGQHSRQHLCTVGDVMRIMQHGYAQPQDSESFRIPEVVISGQSPWTSRSTPHY
jgi:hypothetical protein